MAIKRRKSGYQISWYDAQGRERKRTYKGFKRDQAEQKEREILHKRDYREEALHPRHAPIFKVYTAQWVEQHRPDWKESTLTQYENILSKHLIPTFGAYESATFQHKRDWIFGRSSMTLAFLPAASISYCSFLK